MKTKIAMTFLTLIFSASFAQARCSHLCQSAIAEATEGMEYCAGRTCAKFIQNLIQSNCGVSKRGCRSGESGSAAEVEIAACVLSKAARSCR